MKFDFVIGNPPYHKENAANSRKPALYHLFIEQARSLADRSVIVAPARFLFCAGSAPRDWSRKILASGHLRVLEYAADASRIFPRAEIKGGAAIVALDAEGNYASGIFAPYPRLTSIVAKVAATRPAPLSSIISRRGLYRFSDLFFAEDESRRTRVASGSGDMLTSNIFALFPEIFREDGEVPVRGRIGGRRVIRCLPRAYLRPNKYLDAWNVLVAEANGAGKYGETLRDPLISPPGSGHTDTFLSVGAFAARADAENCLLYLKTKFARALLGALKKTQHNPAPVWRSVPIPDFAGVDWSRPLADIDRQFYDLYGLDADEREFIESRVADASQ